MRNNCLNCNNYFWQKLDLNTGVPMSKSEIIILKYIYNITIVIPPVKNGAVLDLVELRNIKQQNFENYKEIFFKLSEMGCSVVDIKYWVIEEKAMVLPNALAGKTHWLFGTVCQEKSA